MSLGGIAIAIGAMVDAAIVMIENAHKHIEAPAAGRVLSGSALARDRGSPAKGGRPALFFSAADHHRVLLPVFALEAPGGPAVRRWPSPRPMPWRRGAAVGDAGAGADAVLRAGRTAPEAKNPVNRLLIWLYRPIIQAVLRFR